jgi:hypothetical protein
MYSTRRALTWSKVWGDTKNKRSAISLYQVAIRASAKQLWRAVEAFKCRHSEMKRPVRWGAGEIRRGTVGVVEETKDRGGTTTKCLQGSGDG